MLRTKKLRDVMFVWHRYLGLTIGIVLAIVGLTASVLVFHAEIADYNLHQEIGQISPQGNPLPLEVIAAKVQNTLAEQPDSKLNRISPVAYHRLYQNEVHPVYAGVEGTDDRWTEIYADPYTGEILAQHQWKGSFFDYVYRLHYQLLAGDWGMYFVGIVALLSSILCVTGIVLWPGWRKLAAGFKIKWNAKPKRLNFDLHKVAGIVAAVFLFFATFTGFLWNFWDWSEPATYTVLLSEKPVDPVSQVIPGRSPISVSQVMQKADAALEGKIINVVFPAEPTGAFEVRKKLPQDANYWGEHRVYIDQYSGNVIRVDTTNTRSFAAKFLNAESTVHYGTFAGFASRLLYVFVGLAPTMLLITGLVMWRLRKKNNTNRPTLDPPELMQHS